MSAGLGKRYLINLKTLKRKMAWRKGFFKPPMTLKMASRISIKVVKAIMPYPIRKKVGVGQSAGGLFVLSLMNSKCVG